ncbi:glutaminyl-peptide cyclotransferase [Ochrovirga pacifica]|uniref:glutaminyl-peptide cyclotransferase n=1 Tax=Ochrovirga pacifica TaxID=1042376 RepID=UPI0002557FC4|nr:glutaminyl-peptide cyclotransferase [Ochrovirga pacifica]
MKLRPYLYVLLAFSGLSSCQKEIDFALESPEKIQIHQKLLAQINMPLQENMKIIYYLDNQKVGTDEQLELSINEYRLGNHLLKVGLVQESDTVYKEKNILFLAKKRPEILNYKVIASYPHDREAFTQGLEFYNGNLYEGTGQNGKSVLRKVDLETGKVLQEQKLADKYFGEGITFFNDQVYQLTWKSNMGFIYDAKTFKVVNTFNYHQSKEGWGLAHNNTHLIKSDGTEKIWFLDPKTGKETHHIEVYTNTRRVEEINELEYVEGKIYANVWTKNAILIINPKNGAVEAIINLKGLTKELENKTIAQSTDKVLNGIAYHTTEKKLYVTGKNWDKLFEIEIVK